MPIEQILASSGALVTAVVIAVNALKAMGLPGKIMPFISILLGIGGAYLTISHDPALFVIIGILVTGTENGIFVLNQTYFQKKYEKGEAPAQATEDPAIPAPTPATIEDRAAEDVDLTPETIGAPEPEED